jgi:hypothetical protein
LRQLDDKNYITGCEVVYKDLPSNQVIVRYLRGANLLRCKFFEKFLIGLYGSGSDLEYMKGICINPHLELLPDFSVTIQNAIQSGNQGYVHDKMISSILLNEILIYFKNFHKLKLIDYSCDSIIADETDEEIFKELPQPIQEKLKTIIDNPGARGQKRKYKSKKKYKINKQKTKKSNKQKTKKSNKKYKINKQKSLKKLAQMCPKGLKQTEKIYGYGLWKDPLNKKSRGRRWTLKDLHVFKSFLK